MVTSGSVFTISGCRDAGRLTTSTRDTLTRSAWCVLVIKVGRPGSDDAGTPVPVGACGDRPEV